MCDKVVTALTSDLHQGRPEDNIDKDGFRMTEKGGLLMFLAESADASTYTPFDIFMVVFTVLIAVGLIRLLLHRPRKNLFAIGFAAVCLIVFLIADAKMISGW
jgi:hypothetical protein